MYIYIYAAAFAEASTRQLAHPKPKMYLLTPESPITIKMKGIAIKMDKGKIQNMILREEKYDEVMNSVVLPYLEQRKTEQYCEREEGRRIFYVKCLADNPRGIAVISHGYTETVEKHLENIYYFLCGGYHVFMAEHCGHGHSYRMCSDAKDLSLVHVDDYMRYVEDLLFIARSAAKEFPDLPILLYGHSMGGGIAAAAAAHAPELFSRLVFFLA